MVVINCVNLISTSIDVYTYIYVWTVAIQCYAFCLERTHIHVFPD